MIQGDWNYNVNIFILILFQSIILDRTSNAIKAGAESDPLSLIQMWAGLWIHPHLSHLGSVPPPLTSLSRVSELAEPQHLPPSSRREAGRGQMWAYLLKNNDSGCMFSTEQSQPVNCDTVPKTATLNKPAAKQSSEAPEELSRVSSSIWCGSRVSEAAWNTAKHTSSLRSPPQRADGRIETRLAWQSRGQRTIADERGRKK